MKWWQTSVFYQIYPRSFADGNGDGIGDFHGMIEKIDYLQDLGIDAVWLSPHFPSPLIDCGYDISDYSGVAPEYGTMDEFRSFLGAAHQRGIRVILDLVLNHTSDQHPWFIESRSNRDNSKRDWYIWLDGKDGKPPNNWSSCFDGPAWEYDQITNQYYYHYFFKQQPDLNWRNPAVKQAMFDAARFWLDMDVDGFRLDAIGTIYERTDLRNQPLPFGLAELRGLQARARTPEEHKRVDKYWKQMFKHQVGQPGLHTLMKELRAVLDEYPGDRMLVGEDDDIAYLGNGHDQLNLVFNFPLMNAERLTPAHVRMNQQRRLAALQPINGWPCNTLGNHDSPRIYTRYSDGKNDEALARLHLALILTLRGTPFLYNGEEIGMTDYYLNDISQFRDSMAIQNYQDEINFHHSTPDQALKLSAGLTRDKNRTPMQWDNAPNAGFCPSEVLPWLPINPNYATGVNVSEQDPDPDSLLNYYRLLLYWRRVLPALQQGDFTLLTPHSKNILAYQRTTVQQNLLVALNFASQPHTFHWKKSLSDENRALEILFRTYPTNHQSSNNSIHLAPFEALIAEIKPDKTIS
jgi:alpha-glucosidase